MNDDNFELSYCVEKQNYQYKKTHTGAAGGGCWIVYTDGSCMPTSSNGYGAWAGIILSPAGEKKTVSGSEYPTTNNRQEMTAILEGIRATPVGSDVMVYSDSEYCVQTFSSWCWKWAQKQSIWGKKKNTDIVKLVMDEMNKRQVKFQWVRGHNGNPINEECDRICNTLAYNLWRKSCKFMDF